MSNIITSQNDKVFIKYQTALNKVETKIKQIQQQLEVAYDRKIIEHVKKRIKSLPSIQEKLQKHGYQFTPQNMEEYLSDIAGIRIVCYFINDLEIIIKLLQKDFDLEIVRVKNYVVKPKENGYSSYHMIVKVPVTDYINARQELVEVEIQIRTLAMDLWASLEHKVYYKKNNHLSQEEQLNIIEASHLTYTIDKELGIIIQKLNERTKKFISQQSLIYDLNMNNLITDNMLFKYNVALENLKTKLCSLKEGYQIYTGTTPIEHIDGRLKSKKSIYKKLEYKNLAISEENIEKLTDISGIKVVCSFLSDLEPVIRDIKSLPGVKVVGIDDYITIPKSNGYRAYHLILEEEVYIAGKKENVQTEVQIMTKSMNMWACLEHKLCYHKETTEEIKDTLKEYADILKNLDCYFDYIYKQIKYHRDTQSETSDFKKRILNKQVNPKI